MDSQDVQSVFQCEHHDIKKIEAELNFFFVFKKYKQQTNWKTHKA